MYSCRYGYTEITNYLIDNGADLNIKNKNDSTALIYACMKGHTEIA